MAPLQSGFGLNQRQLPASHPDKWQLQTHTPPPRARVCVSVRQRQRGPVVLCLDEVIGPHPEPSITRQRRMKINPNIEAESRATKWLDRDRHGGAGYSHSYVNIYIFIFRTRLPVSCARVVLLNVATVTDVSLRRAWGWSRISPCSITWPVLGWTLAVVNWGWMDGWVDGGHRLENGW